MLVAMMNYYQNCEDFKTYVDKYCKMHCIDILYAMRCALVQETYKYYISENRNFFKDLNEQ